MGAGAILRGLTQAGTRARLGHVKGRQDAEAMRQAQLEREAEEQKQLQAQLRQEALLKFQMEAPKRQREQFDYEQDVQHRNRIAEIAERAKQERETNRLRPIEPKGGSSAGGKGRPMPSAAVEKFIGLDNLLGQTADVVRDLESVVAEGVDATGRAGGVIPEPAWVMNLRRKGGDRGRDIRVRIGNLFSTLAKERGGTALSAPEIALLESFLPNKDDNEPDALAKAKRFYAELTRMKANKEKGYAQYGYGTGVSPASDLSDADLYEQLRDEGLSHEEAVAQVEARKQ